MADDPTDSYDAIVIGAGVIGAAVGYELARPGTARSTSTSSRRRLRLDEQQLRHHPVQLLDLRRCGDGVGGPALLGQLGRLPRRPRSTSGARSTSSSAARAAQEAEGGHHEKVVPLLDRARHPVRGLDARRARRALPGFDARSFGPPKRPDDDGSGPTPPSSSSARSGRPTPATSPTRSSRPTTCSGPPRRSAASSGSTPRSTASTGRRPGDRRDAGDRRVDDRPIVVNVAGPTASSSTAWPGSTAR